MEKRLCEGGGVDEGEGELEGRMIGWGRLGSGVGKGRGWLGFGRGGGWECGAGGGERMEFRAGGLTVGVVSGVGECSII